ncbi:ISNCY family transposase, partial [Photobacterium damselae]|nr:ISNCY family transposase [Photobacterium damselae]MCG9706729.1 ISNCY family transposase [Photobacterium damselae]MCG9707075.1 ISNCY family transposase [Photobacterium damselae]
VFDKLRTVNQAAIVDNKRLSAVLAFAKQSQDQREYTPERTRCKRNISRAAQQRAMNIALMKESDTV